MVGRCHTLAFVSGLHQVKAIFPHQLCSSAAGFSGESGEKNAATKAEEDNEEKRDTKKSLALQQNGEAAACRDQSFLDFQGYDGNLFQCGWQRVPCKIIHICFISTVLPFFLRVSEGFQFPTLRAQSVSRRNAYTHYTGYCTD